ncbi:MAG: hypothetical protein JXA10_11135 [Anaerolineae bacterium]|nr:hypothetical protein [Anaerolineae bacterium]
MDDINLYLQNNDNLLPRDQVQITKITATPHPDGRRVNVAVEVTPFRERPNLEIAIFRAAQTNGADHDNDAPPPPPKPITSTSVIAIMNFRVDFNLHLRGLTDTAGEYTVQVTLYYDDAHAPQHTHSVEMVIDPGEPD